MMINFKIGYYVVLFLRIHNRVLILKYQAENYMDLNFKLI